MIEEIADIHGLIQAEKFAALAEIIEQLPVDERMVLVTRLPPVMQQHLIAGLDSDLAADLVHVIPDAQTVDLIGELEPADAVSILKNLPSDERADIVGDLEDDEAEAILGAMLPRESAKLRKLAMYDDDVAGGLMTTEFLAFHGDETIDEIVVKMRQNVEKYSDLQVQYAYVVNSANQLIGVLRLRDLLLGEPSTRLSEIMIRSPISIPDSSGMIALRQFFDDHHYLGVPVTDANGVLVGVVNETDVEEAWAHRNADDYRKSQGIVQEELRTMPLMVRSRRRLAWLSINIVLNMVAASVIAVYQETLTQVIALAVFLPIISDMSGCSGNQAVAVSMRELSLGVIRPTEIMFVWLKEVSVGLINGLSLGFLIAMVGYFWKGNPWLGLVIGVAMMANTVIAVSLGGTLPLIMRLLKLDPALASGPILTTVTDMCGFLLVLAMATALLDRLV